MIIPSPSYSQWEMTTPWNSIHDRVLFNSELLPLQGNSSTTEQCPKYKTETSVISHKEIVGGFSTSVFYTLLAYFKILIQIIGADLLEKKGILVFTILSISPVASSNAANTLDTCTGSGWEGAYFLHSSPCGAQF